MGSGLEPIVGYLRYARFLPLKSAKGTDRGFRLLQRLFRAADPTLAEVIER